MSDSGDHAEEFQAIFFGRRHSHRYRLTAASAAAAAAGEGEKEERNNTQLRLQLLLGGCVLLLFVAAFSVIITLLLIKEDTTSFLLLEPKNSQGGSFVSVARDNNDDMATLLARIGGELDAYAIRRWLPRLRREGRVGKDCDTLAAYPAGMEVCVPSLEALGVCNAFKAFGYVEGNPCVLVKAGAALGDNYTEHLLVQCSAAVDASGAELQLRYHPMVTYLSQEYTYFPRYYFPYRPDSSTYLPPVAMVQVMQAPIGQSFSLNCSLANAAFGNYSTHASLQLLLR